MVIDEFIELALSFPETVEAPHFDKIAFKVIGKRIFATLQKDTALANIKLPAADQSTFCDYNKTAVYAVPNKWGLQGWTTFELNAVPRELMLEALHTAYKEVFKSKQKRKGKGI